jgi:multidrug transporter EmrE-like cation transporter
MIWLLPLSLLIAFEVVADIFAKEYSLRGQEVFWIAAIASYILANVFWLSAIKNGSGLARGAILFSVGSAIGAALVGMLVYHERLHALQIAGIVLGVVALTFILWE